MTWERVVVESEVGYKYRSALEYHRQIEQGGTHGREACCSVCEANEMGLPGKRTTDGAREASDVEGGWGSVLRRSRGDGEGGAGRLLGRRSRHVRDFAADGWCLYGRAIER